MSQDMKQKWPASPLKTQISLGIRPVDQSLRSPHEVSLGPKLPIERTAKILVKLGGCPGLSEFAGCTCHFVGFVMRWLKYPWHLQCGGCSGVRFCCACSRWSGGVFLFLLFFHYHSLFSYSYLSFSFISLLPLLPLSSFYLGDDTKWFWKVDMSLNINATDQLTFSNWFCQIRTFF